MKKLKITFLLFIVICSNLFIVRGISADSVIDNGLNFLRSKQDATGRINTGFSAPSQWSSIAFAAKGIDISTIKNPDVSLQDFLIGNIPSEPSAATDWETRILAIVATGGDPTNYGGINYVNKLESFYSNNQLGDECSLNDDIFGLLAEIAVGKSANAQIKQSVLSFLISKQDPVDGGFGYSAPGCAWYSTSADMTGASIQALVAAKNNSLIDSGLDNAIDYAKNYLLSNQNTDGGYGYYSSSDSDSTGWVLMAFNVLDLKDSTASANTKNWLLSQQSPDDGGFMAFDYGLNKSVSNSTTTAQSIIALSGKSWILKIFDPTIESENPTPTVTLITTPTPTSTPTSTPTPLASPKPTAEAGTPSPTPSISPSPFPNIYNGSQRFINESDVTSPTPGQILGIKSEVKQDVDEIPNKKNFTLTILFFGLGILSLIIHKGII